LNINKGRSRKKSANSAFRHFQKNGNPVRAVHEPPLHPLPALFVFYGWIVLWGPGSNHLQEEDHAQDRGADEVVNCAGIEEQNPGHGQGGALNPSQRPDQVSADSARKGLLP
jgi:hypothetical protein